MTERWTIPLSDYIEALQWAWDEGDEVQEAHLLNDFWICTGPGNSYALLKSERSK